MKLKLTDLDAVLFDFDGVVVLSEHVYDVATQELAEELDILIPQEFCDRMRGQSDRVFFDAVMQEFQPDIEFEEMVAIGRQILLKAFATGIQHMPGYLDFRALVDRSGLRSGLVTSTPVKLLDYIFENSSLAVRFEQTVTGNDVTNLKPHPEPYLKMCTLMEVQPARALVIEDSPAGVRSARAAGCFVVALTGTSARDSLSPAHFVVDSFAELSELLA